MTTPSRETATSRTKRRNKEDLAELLGGIDPFDEDADSDQSKKSLTQLSTWQVSSKYEPDFLDWLMTAENRKV